MFSAVTIGVGGSERNGSKTNKPTTNDPKKVIAIMIFLIALTPLPKIDVLFNKYFQLLFNNLAYTE